MHFTDDVFPNDPEFLLPILSTLFCELLEPSCSWPWCILSLEPPTDLPFLRALQEGGVATGITPGFRDLNPQDLSLLSGHLAILSDNLAQ